jgi:hypothetical protein
MAARMGKAVPAMDLAGAGATVVGKVVPVDTFL